MTDETRPQTEDKLPPGATGPIAPPPADEQTQTPPPADAAPDSTPGDPQTQGEAPTDTADQPAPEDAMPLDVQVEPLDAGTPNPYADGVKPQEDYS